MLQSQLQQSSIFFVSMQQPIIQDTTAIAQLLINAGFSAKPSFV